MSSDRGDRATALALYLQNKGETPETLEDSAGLLLLASAVLRVRRGNEDDRHEINHIQAAIYAGNSGGCNNDCDLLGLNLWKRGDTT